MLDKNNQAHLASTTYQFSPNANNHDANLHGTASHAIISFQKGYIEHVSSRTIKVPLANGKTHTITTKAHTRTIPTTVNISIPNIGTDKNNKVGKNPVQSISDTYICK